MRVRDWLFSLTGEQIEDVAAPAGARLPVHGRLDSILTKAAYCMVAEVGG